MKAYCLLAALGAALLSGCAVYDRYVPYQPVYSAPGTVTYVSPYYIAPRPGTLLPGAGAASLEAP
jgi:hypothetical protein